MAIDENAEAFDRLISGVFPVETLQGHRQLLASLDDLNQDTLPVPASQGLDINRRYDEQLGCHWLETAEPNVEQLLARFDDLLLRLIAMPDRAAVVEQKQVFIDQLRSEVEPSLHGMHKIEGCRSFVVLNEFGEVNWRVLTEEVDAIGQFEGYSIGPWYDIPEGIKLNKDDNEHHYFRGNGLLVVMKRAQLIYSDSSAANDIIPMGEVAYVPLNHGDPKLKRIILPA